MSPEKARAISNWVLGGALIGSMIVDVYSFVSMRKRDKAWRAAVASDAEKVAADAGSPGE